MMKPIDTDVQILGMTIEEIRVLKNWRDGNPHIKRNLELIKENNEMKHHLREAQRLLSTMAYHLGMVAEVDDET